MLVFLVGKSGVFSCSYDMLYFSKFTNYWRVKTVKKKKRANTSYLLVNPVIIIL